MVIDHSIGINKVYTPAAPAVYQKRISFVENLNSCCWKEVQGERKNS